MTGAMLNVVDLGHRGYHDALALQRDLRLARIDGTLTSDTLLLVEHDPVYTLGRGTVASSLPVPVEQLRARGADVVEIERGGDVTWHGPGQLVGYPIMHLSWHREDLHWYLRQVEEALIRGVAPFGIQGERNVGYTGVWTQGRKLASIGVHARDWVTWHGFALNVTTDLSYFYLMVPCGIAEVTMTSIQRESELRGDAQPVAAKLWQHTCTNVSASFAELFSLDAAAVAPAELERRAAVTV